MALTPRARRVHVECVDEKGEAKLIDASGWYARRLQHEIDHLAGTMYMAQVYPGSLITVEKLTQPGKARRCRNCITN